MGVFCFELHGVLLAVALFWLIDAGMVWNRRIQFKAKHLGEVLRVWGAEKRLESIAWKDLSILFIACYDSGICFISSSNLKFPAMLFEELQSPKGGGI